LIRDISPHTIGKYSGTEVKLNGEEYIIMREEDVLAIVS